MHHTAVNFLAWVHTLPTDLKTPLATNRAYLEEATELYQFVIDSRLLWRIWMIDEFNHYWIKVFRMADDRRPEFHTLKIDEGTFDRIECENYEVEDEKNSGNAAL